MAIKTRSTEAVSPKDYLDELMRQLRQTAERNQTDLWALRTRSQRALDEINAALAGWESITSATAMMMRGHLAELERRVREVMEAAAAGLLGDWRGAWESYWGAGVASVIDPAVAVGWLQLALSVEGTTLRLLDDYAPQLIKDISAAAVREIAAALRRGALIGQSPADVKRAIARVLLGEPGRAAGRFGGWAYQAERIYRTETQRMFATAQHEAAGVWQKATGEDLVKVWRHAESVNLLSRDWHVAMSGETVRYGERFPNGLLYPKDPAGEAREVINCMCYLMVLPATAARAMGYEVKAA